MTDQHPSDALFDCRRVAQGLATLADLCISRTDNSAEVQYEVRAQELGPVVEILTHELLTRMDALERAIAARLADDSHRA